MGQVRSLQPAVHPALASEAHGDEQATAADRFLPAPHGRRLLAHIVDLAVFGALIFLPVLGITMAAPTAFISPEGGASQILELVAALLYSVTFWRLTGTSPGKRLLGLRLVGPDGGHPNVTRSVVRWTVMAILGIPFGLTWWPVLLRKDRRAMHDCLAGTRVVRY
jgi:uncharacterized RDD family membrane protein YckC